MDIRKINTKEVEEVKNIVDERLGASYNYGISELIEISNKIIKVAEADNEIKGYYIGHKSMNPEKIEQKIENIKKINNSGSYFESVAVKSGEGGKGIGTELLLDSVETLEKPIYTLAWIREEHVDSRKLFEKISFQKLKEVENFWYEDSLGKENFCPDCGTPCKCSAALYVFK